MPTGYTYKPRGRPEVEETTLNAVTRLTAGGWKIAGWTWTGVAPPMPRASSTLFSRISLLFPTRYAKNKDAFLLATYSP